MRISSLALVVATLTAPAALTAQHGLNLTTSPYYGSNYAVGMAASWQAVPGAAKYILTQYRQDACASATFVQETTGLSYGSGRYSNCGAPSSCYKFELTVQAVSATGVLLAESKASFCDTGNP